MAYRLINVKKCIEFGIWGALEIYRGRFISGWGCVNRDVRILFKVIWGCKERYTKERIRWWKNYESYY